MTIAAVIGLITAVGTIIGGLVYLVKAGIWKWTPTPDQSAQEIVVQEQKNKQDAEDSGRPV